MTSTERRDITHCLDSLAMFQEIQEGHGFFFVKIEFILLDPQLFCGIEFTYPHSINYH